MSAMAYTRLLIASSSVPLTEAITMLLRNIGYEVKVAVSEEDVFKLATQSEVVILDTDFPYLDRGWEILKMLRQQEQFSAGILLLARTFPLDEIRADSYDELLFLPLSTDEILIAIKEILHSKQ